MRTCWRRIAAWDTTCIRETERSTSSFPEAEYNDNGTITTVKAGDITFTGPGEGHAIINRKDEPMSFMAIILYE